MANMGLELCARLLTLMEEQMNDEAADLIIEEVFDALDAHVTAVRGWGALDASPTQAFRTYDGDKNAAFHQEMSFHRHRGVVFDELDYSVQVFGNDGFTDDERSRAEVRHLINILDEVRLSYRDFGLCGDGYTW